MIIVNKSPPIAKSMPIDLIESLATSGNLHAQIPNTHLLNAIGLEIANTKKVIPVN